MKSANLIKRLFFPVISLMTVMACFANDAEKSSNISLNDMKAIEEVVHIARDAIVSENPNTLLRYISHDNGLSCTDTEYKFSEVQRFITNKNSQFYISLFNTDKYLSQCGSENYSKDFPPISEKEYFQSANHEITVKSIDKNWAKVSFTSTIKNHYPREWFLYKESGKWVISGSSFIIGNCTCG